MTHTAPAPTKTSWMPLVSLFLAQVLMSFNVAALPISLGGMVSEFGVPPTVASTTIVMYGLAVAALVMTCLLYTSPSPRDRQKSRMPSSA